MVDLLNHKVDFTCAKCRRKQSKSIRELERKNTFTCCGVSETIDVKKTASELRNMQKKLDGLFK